MGRLGAACGSGSASSTISYTKGIVTWHISNPHGVRCEHPPVLSVSCTSIKPGKKEIVRAVGKPVRNPR